MDRGKVKKRSPKIMLLVAPFGIPFVPIELVSEDMGGIIQSCEWMKSRSVPGGSVSITMAGDEKALRGLGFVLSKPLEALWKHLGPDLRDLLKPRTLCQLWLDGYHVMTGYVRYCRRQATPGRAIYTVQIDELGTIYQQNILSLKSIWYGEYQSIFSDINSMLGGIYVGAPLWLVINLFINSFIISTLNFGFGGYVRASDGLPLAFRLIALPPPIGGISMNSLISQVVTDASILQISEGGSIWDFIRNLCPDPFMELFTESGGRTICTGRVLPASMSAGILQAATTAVPAISGLNLSVLLPGFNYIIARTSPYDIPWTGLSSWLQLYSLTLGVLDLIMAGDFVIITDDDVISKDLGVSDAQQYTLYHVSYGSKSASGTPGQIQNRPSVSRGPLIPLFPGGVRTYGGIELNTSIDPTGLKWGGVVGQAIERINNYTGIPTNIPALSTLLNVWFRNAGKFNEGTIVTRAIPYARPGMVLLYLPSLSGSGVDNSRDIGLYYIDNIDYRYEIGKVDTTTFSVIRGVPIPMNASALAMLMMDWEVLPPGLNLTDIDNIL